ncbi:MAG: dockerin type I repeat-containing protein, partial [Phycisphaerae bacterium]|nr:dockerin type I repeat-containing protein [Phycisphaerae bacterium]
RAPRTSRVAIARIAVWGGIGAIALALGVSSVMAGGGRGGRQLKVPSTGADFFQPGTQPNPDSLAFNPIVPSQNCTFCHSDYLPSSAPFDSWVASLKGQAARDPVWHAAVTIANQDANIGGETCIRCHAQGAWLGGRSSTGTLAEFTPEDYDGVTCNFCHRVVNPVLGENSAIGYPGDPANPDAPILKALASQQLLPVGPGNARYVVDPADNRRGPLGDVPDNLHGLSLNGELVKLIDSPFHTKSEFCGTCHDVSNPLFVKQRNGTYALGQLNSPHPTQDAHDMFPEQRTYSEWANSEFASTGVSYPDNRFGGPDHPTGVMSSCQDCHMPINAGGACAFYEFEPFFERPVPQHSFSGVNSWVISAVREQLGEEADFVGVTQERVDAAKARNVQMLRDASDMSVSQRGNALVARVTNQSGHKLPTGYPEGRRMWLNVRFFDARNVLLQEIGGYDNATATLNKTGAKIWETKHSISAAVGKLTGLPAGTEFHLTLNDTITKDNRIPPRGFTNAAFAAIQASPVAASYSDGQYWDDSSFAIPRNATHAVVTLYHQTTSREYIEFLRDANVTDSTGQTAYNLWVSNGKSAPIDMDSATIKLSRPALLGDLNGDGKVDAADLGILLGSWGGPGAGDLNNDGIVDAQDLGLLLGAWTG